MIFTYTEGNPTSLYDFSCLLVIVVLSATQRQLIPLGEWRVKHFSHWWFAKTAEYWILPVSPLNKKRSWVYDLIIKFRNRNKILTVLYLDTAFKTETFYNKLKKNRIICLEINGYLFFLQLPIRGRSNNLLIKYWCDNISSLNW